MSLLVVRQDDLGVYGIPNLTGPEVLQKTSQTQSGQQILCGFRAPTIPQPAGRLRVNLRIHRALVRKQAAFSLRV